MLSAADYPMVIASWHLPAIVAPDASLHSMLWNAYRFLASAFFTLILLHQAAALFHALVRHDGVCEAMTPYPG